MANKPNIVVIYTDDLGYGDLSCYGSEEIRTPHLDALAKDGVRFTDWYSNSPVCSPSRAALLTGRYPNRAGVPRILAGKRGTPGLPASEMTLASALKPHGYRTALFGKWHLGVAEDMRPNKHGFDEFFGFLAGCVDYYSHIFYWQQAKGVNPLHDLWHNEREVWHNGRYFTELVTEKGVDFIERGSDDPFFLFASYNAPHYPMHAPKAYLDRYPDLPPDRRIMAAMISAVDDGVGSIVKALKDSGEYENTLIFFSSDNGPSRETRNWLDGNEDLYYGGTAGIFRGHKGSLYEGGIREPAIMAYPGTIPSGQTIDTPCAMFDVFPTVFEAAGLPLPDHQIDGQSVLDLVTGKESEAHDQIFWEYGPAQLAVREGDWKLVLNGREDGIDSKEGPHLANLGSDPSEKVNLAEQEPELVERLTKAVQEWDAEIGGHR
jgi:arylsulfatase A-like enzyme